MDFKSAFQLALNGQENGYRFLYESTCQPVYDFLLQNTSGKEEADRLIGQVYEKAWAGLGGLADPNAFPGWVQSIAEGMVLQEKNGAPVPPLNANMSPDAGAGANGAMTGGSPVPGSQVGASPNMAHLSSVNAQQMTSPNVAHMANGAGQLSTAAKAGAGAKVAFLSTVAGKVTVGIGCTIAAAAMIVGGYFVAKKVTGKEESATESTEVSSAVIGTEEATEEVVTEANTEEVKTEEVTTEEITTEEITTEEAKTPETGEVGSLPFSDSMSFIFLSGVGAWATTLDLKSDGSFSGYFHDSNMGESGDGYEATVYESRFEGRFKNITKVDDYTYKMELDYYNTEKPAGTEEIVDMNGSNVRYLYWGPYGIEGGDVFYFYLPGKPIAELDDAFLSWVWLADSDLKNKSTWDFYGLYNEAMGEGFFHDGE